MMIIAATLLPCVQPLADSTWKFARVTVHQARILAIKQPLAMTASAARLAEQGSLQLKLKLSGGSALDVAGVAEVRAAAGAGVILTPDPNQLYGVKQIRGGLCLRNY